MHALDDLEALVQKLRDLCLARHWSLCTAESCTGGWIAQSLTALAGSSEWFDRGFVTYSNQAKVEMLGVSTELIAQHGAVSGEVAQAMAVGALQHSASQGALSVTGIAGPGGGSAAKPVGTVWFGWANNTLNHTIQTDTQCVQFSGDRQAVRLQAVHFALQGCLARWQ